MVEEDSRVGSLHELICSLKWKCLCVCLCAYDVIECVCLFVCTGREAAVPAPSLLQLRSVRGLRGDVFQGRDGELPALGCHRLRGRCLVQARTEECWSPCPVVCGMFVGAQGPKDIWLHRQFAPLRLWRGRLGPLPCSPPLSACSVSLLSYCVCCVRGQLPGPPFFMRFSPDEESLVMLCGPPAPGPDAPAGQIISPFSACPCCAMALTSPSCSLPGPSGSSIVLLEWGKYFRRDSWAGQAAVARFAPRKALTLLQVPPRAHHSSLFSSSV